MDRSRKHLHTIDVEKKKRTRKMESVIMPLPQEVAMIYPQYHGDVSEPVVEVGTYVTRGQILAEAPGCMPLHSSVSGTVSEMGEIRIAGNDIRKYIAIEADDKEKLSEFITVPNPDTRKTFMNWLRRSGIMNRRIPVFQYFDREEVRSMFVDATETEPVVTSGYRTLMEDTEAIIFGIDMLVKFLNLEKVTVCMEESKPYAVRKFKEAMEAAIHPVRIEIRLLTSPYIQRNNDIITREMTGQPADGSVFVPTVEAVAEIGKFFKTGIPMITKKITVEGDIIEKPQNVIAPLGARIIDIAEFCGGYKASPRKIITDGTIVGDCVASDRVPLMKDMKAVIAFEGKASLMPQPKLCINCGKCYDGCPLRLSPAAIVRAFDNKNVKLLTALHPERCIQCGCCTYVCPAGRPLKDMLSDATGYLREVLKDE